MSQHDYIIDNATFPNVRSDLNSALGAVATNNAGNSAPSTTYANQWWFDSDGNTLYMRNKDNDAWVTVLTIGATSDDVESLTANVITEGTSATGVTIDGLLIKDSAVGAAGTATSVAGIPFYTADNSIYTHDVSGTDSTATYNTAYGLTSLDAVTTADKVTAIGYGAGGAITTGGNNTMVGYFAGEVLVDGDGNVLVGSQAGKDLTSGSNNVAIGQDALAQTTTADFNTAIGRNALQLPDTEAHNLAIGFSSMSGSIAGGEFNVTVGNYTGDAITSGDHNTIVGYSAGSGLTTGSDNVIIGSSCSMANITHNNAIIIGKEITGNGDRFSFGKPSNVVQNTFTSDANWSRTSDERLKTNVNNVGWKSLDFINELRPVTFNWKASQDVPTDMAEYYPNVNHMDTTTVIDGLIAQEVKTAIDNNNMTNFSGWKTDPSGTQTLSKEAFVVPLIKAVQELSATVTTLQQEINALKGE